MRRNYLLYILVLLGILAVSCKDDAIECASGFSESDGRLLSIAVDIPETRTRAVDLTPGAALYLNNIWVGVYEKYTGKRVGDATKELGRMLTSSDNTLIDLVGINFYAQTAANTNDRYCVVGVANYDGIKVIDPVGDTAADLKSMLDNADTWSKFKDIAIDTRNSEFENQVPLLIGYLGKETVMPQKGKSSYTKVDQFKDGDGINLYGYENEDDVFVEPRITNGRLSGINTKYDDSNGVHNYILKLRRMRSKINVIINEEPVPGITVTNIQYKMCNVPGSAFLAQRRTNTFSDMLFDRNYSANSADVKYGNNIDGYFDTEFETPDINTNFSFEHFENKHWAKNSQGLTEYHDREKHDENGVFSALAVDAEDWNNMASYFVLKMNIRDDNIGRNAEIEYMIHEGFCNDADGIALTNDTGYGVDDVSNELRLSDFSCVRNTDYYYKIKINSINDIEVQVTDSDFHTNDQKGKVWDIEYFSDNMIVSSEGIEIEVPVSLKGDDDDRFVNSEDIAFRFVGSYFNTEKMKEIPVDICYNFSRGDLDGFAGIWDVPTNESTEYIVAKTSQDGEPISAYESLLAFCEGGSDNALHFNRIINDIKVKYSGAYRNIIDYLEVVTKDNETDPNINGFKFEGLKYYEVFDRNNDDLRNHIRGLYIFDTQKAFSDGTRVRQDNDGCTFLYQIKGIEQVPVYLTAEEYEMISVSGDKKIAASESATFTEFSDGHTGSGMLLSEYPDIAFRLLGYDGNTNDYYDILYNFTQNEYTDLTNDWPQMNLNGNYSSSLAKGALGANTIPASFLEGLKIIVKDSEYNIYDFVTQYENGDIQLSKDVKLGFKVAPYEKSVNTDTPEKYLRALYLFDKKNKFVEPALLSQDGNSAIFQVYAVEQLPTYYPPVYLTLPTQSAITTINSTNNYNFIDEKIDEQLRIPVIPDVALSDYKYKVIVKNSNGKEEGCFVDVEPINGYFNFNIPIRAIPGSGGDIYLQAVSTSDRYISTDVSTFSIGHITLKNPKWDFGSNEWAAEFKKWTQSGAYYIFSSGSHTLNNLKIRSKGKEVRGYPNDRLYFNSGTSDLFITTYKNCKVIVSVLGGSGDRILYVNPGGYSYNVTKNDTASSSTNIDIGSNYSDDIIIKFSGSASFYSVSLVEAD